MKSATGVIHTVTGAVGGAVGVALGLVLGVAVGVAVGLGMCAVPALGVGAGFGPQAPAAAAGTATGGTVGAEAAVGAEAGATAGTPSDPPLLQLTSDPVGTVHLLAPGVPALWRVGVTTRVQSLDSLVGYLRASGALSSLGPHTTVALSSCTVPWTNDGCSAGAHSILPATSIDQLTQPAAPLTDPARRIPAHVYLQANVLLAANTPVTVQGSTVAVVATVSASGVIGPGAPGPVVPGGIADTGTDLVGSLLLAVAAVASGAAIAGVARRRRSSRVPR